MRRIKPADESSKVVSLAAWREKKLKNIWLDAPKDDTIGKVMALLVPKRT